MVKEGRTWWAVVQVSSEHGKKRIDAVVCAPDFDSAVGMVRRTWPNGEVQRIETAVYEAVVLEN